MIAIALSFIGPDFTGANLALAEFQNANFYGADFRGAKNLIPERVKAAKNWDKAYYDPEFQKKLGLPAEGTK